MATLTIRLSDIDDDKSNDVALPLPAIRPLAHPPHTRTLSASDLSTYIQFFVDLKLPANHALPWDEGIYLQIVDSFLVGTQHVHRPTGNLRLLILANGVSIAASDIDDPWSMVAIQDPAKFVVVDRYSYGKTTQLVLVELGDGDVFARQTFELDGDARQALRNLLVDTDPTSPPSWALSEQYKKAIGDTRISFGPGLLDFERRLAAIDVADVFGDDIFEVMHEEGEPSLDLDDERLIRLATIPDPADPSNSEGHYVLATTRRIDSYIDRYGDQCDYMGNAYAFEVVDGRLVPFARGAANEMVATNRFTEEHVSIQYQQSLAKITSFGGGVKGNVNIRDERGRNRRVASWRFEDDTHIVSYQRPSEIAYRCTFATFPEMVLYLNVVFGKRRLDQMKADPDQITHESLRDKVPRYKRSRRSDGLIALTALDRRHAADISLQAAESLTNTQIASRRVPKDLISRIYRGTRYVSGLGGYDLYREKLWYAPLEGSKFRAIRRSEREAILARIERDWRDAQDEGDEDLVGEDEFYAHLRALEESFAGNVQATHEQIARAVDLMDLPYQLTFAYRISAPEECIRIALFLPSRHLFPFVGPTMRSLGSFYRRAYYSPEFRRRHFSDFACQLTLLLLELVKSAAPWITRLCINTYLTDDLENAEAIDQTEGDSENPCVISLDVSERILFDNYPFDAEHPERPLIAMGASVASRTSGSLEPVEELFPRQAAMETLVNFTRLYHGRPLPYAPLDPFPDDAELLIERMSTVVRSLLYKDNFEMAREIGLLALEGVVERAHISDYIRLEPASHRRDGHDSRALVPHWNKRRRELSCRDSFSRALCEMRDSQLHSGSLPMGLAELLSLIGDAHRAEDAEVSRRYYEAALHLEPTCCRALTGLFSLAAETNDAATATKRFGEALESARSGDDLGNLMLTLACHANDAGFHELAFASTFMGFYMVHDPDISQVALRKLAKLAVEDEELEGRFLKDIDKGAVLALETLSHAGLGVHLAHDMVELACTTARQAVEDGADFDTSYLRAYQCAIRLEGYQDPKIKELIAMTTGLQLHAHLLPQLLFRPIAFTGTDLALDFDRYFSSLDFENPHHWLIVVPVIDTFHGLLFHVAGLWDIHGRRMSEKPSENIFLSDTALDGDHFILLNAERCGSDVQRIIDADRIRFAVTPQMEETRQLRSVDRLRSFLYPDDIAICLERGGQALETAWMTMGFVDLDGSIHGVLRSTPKGNFGLLAGDTINVQLENVEGSRFTRAVWHY